MFHRFHAHQWLTIIITVFLASAASADDTALEQQARALHDRILVIDAHADIAVPDKPNRFAGPDGLSQVHPSKLQAGGVSAIVMAAGIGYGPRTGEADAAAREIVNEELVAVRTMAQENPDLLTIATRPADLKSAKAAGKIALMLGFQNARALERDIDVLNDLYNAGVRVFALNHLGHNDYSDSSRPNFNGETKTYEPEEEHGGLSDLGKAAIARINALGGLVDVSQMSKNATLQTVALSKAPVIASHSNVRALSNVTRNLSDVEIDAIGAKGGVIHISPFSAYLVDLSDPELLAKIKEVRLGAGLPETYSYPYELYWELEPDARTTFLTAMRAVVGRSSVDRMIDHIDYVKARIGGDHIGVGSDFNHGGGINGFADASEAFSLTLGLLKRGYTETDIEKIWGGNFVRVFDAAQRGRTQ